MIRMGFAYSALLLAPALFATSCGESKGDPKAEAPPTAKVEHEQDVNSVKVDHPEQFPLFTAIEHAATTQLVARAWWLRICADGASDIDCHGAGGGD